MQRTIGIKSLGWIGFLILILTARVGAQDAGSKRLLRQVIRGLESSYKQVQTLQASFTQIYRAGGGRSRTETGVVYFARGGRMRWEYNEPEEKTFIANRKNAYLYVPAENLVTRSTTKETDDVRVPFRLLLQRPRLNRIFSRVEAEEDLPPLEPENVILRCFPKDRTTGYREVLIEVNPAYDIRRIIIYYLGPNTMEFDFTAIRRNVPLAASLFSFTLPPGSRMIDSP